MPAFALAACRVGDRMYIPDRDPRSDDPKNFIEIVRVTSNAIYLGRRADCRDGDGVCWNRSVIEFTSDWTHRPMWLARVLLPVGI